MAQTPTQSKKVIRKDLRIGTPINPQRYANFKPTVESEKPAQDLLLSEYVAAVRREIEAVALIAAPQDKEVPHFHVSEVELELVCAVAEVSDAGMRVNVDQAKLKEVPETMLQRIKLKLTDPVVAQLQSSPREKG